MCGVTIARMLYIYIGDSTLRKPGGGGEGVVGLTLSSSQVISAAKEIVVHSYLVAGCCANFARPCASVTLYHSNELLLSLPPDRGLAKLLYDLTGRSLSSCKHASFRARLYAFGRQVQ